MININKTKRNIETKRIRKDLTGMVFGDLTVIGPGPDYRYGNTVKKVTPTWNCKCSCGKEINISQDRLLYKKITSCGCKNSNAFKDMTGEKIGKLTVLSRAEDYVYNGGADVRWLCECECGNKIIVKGSSLRKRKTLSCGCDKTNNESFKHGLSGTPAYNTYNNMKKKAIKDNIIICNEWSGENGLINFCNWANSNGIDKGKSLILIDKNGEFSPNNCKIIDTVIMSLTYNGETHTIYEWEKILGIEAHIIYSRLKNGWSIERALTTPSSKYVKTITDSNGITKTIKEWSEETGISPYVLYRRANSNWEPDKILYQALTRTGGPAYITFNNNIYTQTQWEYILGVRPGTISNRIYQGMTPEEALTNRERISTNGIYFVDDNKMPIAQDEVI